MAMNRVQFQPGLSMAEFMRRFGTDRQCEQALVAARWPDGFRCPGCGDSRASVFEREGRQYWQCCRCRQQTTATAGTIFAASKLPLSTWFLAMHLLTQSKNNVSALELKRHLGVSYPTAWLVKHKLMQVMAGREDRRILQGRVEIDDAYLGGERPGKVGRGSPNKIPFIAAVQTSLDGKPERVCFKAMRFTKDGIQDWANRVIHADALVYSDALPSLKAGLAAEVANYHAIKTGSGRAAVLHPEFRNVNTVLGNLKTAISGTYHAFAFAKYADRYLAEVAYRFNRRFDLKSILSRLIRAAATSRAYPAPVLRLAEVRC
ncbi:MAG TPA: IS1595 family transposase [Nevskiales bacterium]|nr:IS1595 family transposase [Nevskiales bacterium]